MTASKGSGGHRKTIAWILIVLAVVVSVFIYRRLADNRQLESAAEHEKSLAALLKRNQSIVDCIPTLSEWVRDRSLEGKQLRKPYPTLEEIEKRIGKADKTEALGSPGKPAELTIARWYYGPGSAQADLALEAEFLNEGGTWRLNGITFWRGKDAPGDTLEYIGRDLMYWKETRTSRRQSGSSSH